eukprot:TRINITY_DN10214_c0_g1_i3.p1 TRINITY_DN10214_c0_g1~~TRINITY_DN10214_c0_g1_i3.p1  ORF type:complete len:200 (+),score=48.41 TRINITY_DN10214_c0_g1_i3:132-731(+)
MIRRPPRSTLSSSSAASDVYKRQVQLPALVSALTGALAFYLSHHGWFEENSSFDLHTYTTLLVSLLLVFRTTSSYEAYKASITAFNSMITTAHNLGTQICSYVTLGSGHHCGLKQLLRLSVVMCVCIKSHIMREPLSEQLVADGMITPHEMTMLQSVQKSPVAVAFWMRLRLQSTHKNGNIQSPMMMMVLDNSITQYLE